MTVQLKPFFFLALLFVVFTACNKDNESESDLEIGRWKIVAGDCSDCQISLAGQMAGYAGGISESDAYIEFKTDGTAVSSGMYLWEGNWEIPGALV